MRYGWSFFMPGAACPHICVSGSFFVAENIPPQAGERRDWDYLYYMESIGKDAQGRRSGKPYGGKQPAVI